MRCLGYPCRIRSSCTVSTASCSDGRVHAGSGECAKQKIVPTQKRVPVTQREIASGCHTFKTERAKCPRAKLWGACRSFRFSRRVASSTRPSRRSICIRRLRYSIGLPAPLGQSIQGAAFPMQWVAVDRLKQQVLLFVCISEKHPQFSWLCKQTDTVFVSPVDQNMRSKYFPSIAKVGAPLGEYFISKIVTV